MNRAPDRPAAADVESSRMPLIDHLVELKQRLIKIIVFALLGCIACFAFAQNIWDALVLSLIHI